MLFNNWFIFCLKETHSKVEVKEISMHKSSTLNHPFFIQKSIEIVNDNFREPMDTFFKTKLLCAFLEEAFPDSQGYNISFTSMLTQMLLPSSFSLLTSILIACLIDWWWLDFWTIKLHRDRDHTSISSL